MATWGQIVAEHEEFANRARACFDAGVHKTIATLRADGSPRISGIETIWAQDDLWFGSMPAARKAIDLRRDPRFALHSPSADPPQWERDAKLSGRAEEITDADRRLAVFGGGSEPPPPEAHLFRAEISELVLVGLNEARDKLVIEFWHEGRGLETIERD